jgi:hypothetical protein
MASSSNGFPSIDATRAGRDHLTRGRTALRAITVLGVAALGFGGAPAHATPAAGAEHTVTLCHATDSDSNPYVVVTVDVASVRFVGHDDHDGPTWAPDHAKHEKWGDIIPAFDYGSGRQYAGKNVEAGQAILDNGCVPEL